MSSSQQWEFPPYTKTIHRASYPAIDPTNPANSAAGKVVLVTGGGNGVGKGIAKAFVRAGAKAVAILGRRENVLVDAEKDLESAGSSKILAFPSVDILDEPALNVAFEATEKEVGKIDVVVANAGYLPATGPAATAESTDWWKAFEVNIRGTLLTFQAFLKHKSGNSPTFISLSSGVAHAGIFPKFSSYAVSKTGAAQLITYLQAENPDVRVMSLHPGVIESEMNVKSGMTLSRDDISLPSSFAVWLASPAASWAGGRYFWSHWNVDELLQRKDEIVAENELALTLKGFPRDVGEANVVW